MPISLSVVSAAASEPVTLTEAKLHLREDGTEQDTHIEGLITAARELIEGETGRVMMAQTVRQYFDDFPEDDGTLRLAIYPARSVSSVNYLDSDGDTTVLAASSYRADVVSEPARIDPAYGTSWPETYGVSNGVWVDVAAGYSAIGTVPQGLKQAILLIVGHWFENREASVPGTMSELPLAVQRLIARWAVYTQ